jgi:hypothetical protein
VLLAWLGVGCCGVMATENPQSVLQAYARALEQARADDAYGLLSEDARRSLSVEAFRRLVKDDPEAAREFGHSLARPTRVTFATATIKGPSGQELLLVLENRAWRVDISTLEMYTQDTPRHAIAGFVRAVENKRYDIVLRYVPDAHRDGLDEQKLREAWEGEERTELEQVILALKRALSSATIEETGDRATLPYGSARLLLVRERGQWKLENF